MAKQPCIFVVFSTWLLFVLCAHLTYGNFFSSLRFTRESLIQFSRGTQRTVEILTPKKTTKAMQKTDILSKRKDHFGFDGPPARPKIPVTETVVTYQKKRKIYRQRSSPSNKFLEILHVIERAVANANAFGDENDAGTLSKLEALIVKAVQSKRFHYGRQVSQFTVLIMTYGSFSILSKVVPPNANSFSSSQLSLAPVVQTLDSAIHRINHYPADKH